MEAKANFLLIIVSLISISCASKKPEIVIGLTEGIHHDDFEYSVTNYSDDQKIGVGSDTLMAKRKFYIVTLEVLNEAKRVNHEWDNSIAYVIDEAGNTYENNVENQQLLNRQTPFGWLEKHLTKPQSKDSTRLVFELPLNIKHPYLMVRGETLMGDFFDGEKFKRTKIKLFN